MLNKQSIITKNPFTNFLYLDNYIAALRGAATLRARLQKGAATISLLEEQVDEGKNSNYSPALNFVSRGGELLKRTRKGNITCKIYDTCARVISIKTYRNMLMQGIFTGKTSRSK